VDAVVQQFRDEVGVEGVGQLVHADGLGILAEPALVMEMERGGVLEQLGYSLREDIAAEDEYLGLGAARLLAEALVRRVFAPHVPGAGEPLVVDRPHRGR
jgi:hypothetical protein